MVCLLVHKSSIGRAPAYIADMLTAAGDVPFPSLATLRAALNADNIVPRTTSRFGDRAFSVAAPRAWNRLPADPNVNVNVNDEFI